jgi:hypothetical protein
MGFGRETLFSKRFGQSYVLFAITVTVFPWCVEHGGGPWQECQGHFEAILRNDYRIGADRSLRRLDATADCLDPGGDGGGFHVAKGCLHTATGRKLEAGDFTTRLTVGLRRV